MNRIYEIDIITRFFLFCSGASLDLISKCPKFEIIKYASIGATIFFTSILAFISSFFALSIIFESIFISILTSFFWSFIIFNLDRYIVSSLTSDDVFFYKIAKALPRILIAIVIAITISKPFEVKLFSNEIKNYAIKQQLTDLNQLDSSLKKSLLVLDSKRSEITKAYENKLALQEEYYKDYKCECDGTCGTMLKGRGVECLSKKNKYDDFLIEMKFERTQYERLISDNSDERKLYLEEFKDDKDKILASKSLGFFNQIKILDELDNISIYFIMLIFILVELSPIVIKLFSSNGPYDSLFMSQVNEYKLTYLKSVDKLENERITNKKLIQFNSQKNIENKEYEIEQLMNKKALERYEELKKSFKNKISQN